MASGLFDRRQVLQAIGLITIADALPADAAAGPLDTQQLDRRAKVLKMDTLIVPGSGANKPGLAGADVVAPGRGFLGIDWAIQDKHELTVMLLTGQQKIQVSKGQQPVGDPLLRVDIQGPETAGVNVQVGAGTYFIAVLNRKPPPASIVYRTSFVAF
jgi:hypothetical protein